MEQKRLPGDANHNLKVRTLRLENCVEGIINAKVFFMISVPK